MKSTQALSDPVDAAIIATDSPRRDATDAHDRQGDEDSNNRDRADDELHDWSFFWAGRDPRAITPLRGARSGRARLVQSGSAAAQAERIRRNSASIGKGLCRIPNGLNSRTRAGFGRHRGHHDDRQLAVGAAKRTQHVPAGGVGQVDVEQHQVEAVDRSRPRWLRRPLSPPPPGSRGPQEIAPGSAAAAVHPPPGESSRSRCSLTRRRLHWSSTHRARTRKRRYDSRR